MTKPTVHILCGLPASGKSTFARSLRAVRFNLDDMRAMQGFGVDSRHLWTRQNEEAVKEALVRGVVATVDAGLDVVVDNTHLTPKFPRAIRDKMHGKANFKVHSFLDVPINVCIDRDSQREQSVGESVIRNLAKSHQGATKNGWKLDDDWMNLWPAVVKAQMSADNPPTYVCDLDGTAALHVNRGPYEVQKLLSDELNYSLSTILHQAHMRGYLVVFLSGRDEGEARDLTVRWLKKNFVNYHALHMRPTGDYRPDYVVKYELFKKYVEPNYNVQVCFDDRDQCVALWRQLGLPTHQVNFGNF